MSIEENAFLKGQYFEIEIEEDVVLNDRNKDEIINEISHIVDNLSEHLLEYIYRGFIGIKRIYDGFLIKEALNDVINYIQTNAKNQQKVIYLLHKSFNEALIKYCYFEDLKKVFYYLQTRIKNHLIKYKIPNDIPIILNIKDIDIIKLQIIPSNVVAIVLDEFADITIKRALSRQKIIYISTNQNLKQGEYYFIDLLQRSIGYITKKDVNHIETVTA